MPYVIQERRSDLDRVVDELVKLGIVSADTIYHLVVGHVFNNPKYKDLCKVVNEVGVKPNGDINYILFKYCKYHIKPSYNNYKEFMGMIYQMVDFTFHDVLEYKNEFREAAEWIRIKLLTPYEEKAIERNGDV